MMIDELSALAALEEHKTMTRAAIALHISQSAVSKRIATLEQAFDKSLIERTGRRVILTPLGVDLLRRTQPLLAELKDVFAEERYETTGKLTIALSLSVLIEGGATALAKTRDRLPGLVLDVTAEYASVAVEMVRSGDVLLALVQGDSKTSSDLTSLFVSEQELVIIPSGLKTFRFPRKGSLPIMSVDKHSEAGHAIERGLKRFQSESEVKFVQERSYQSFAVVARLALAGFGHGLVPFEVAKGLGVKESKVVRFPKSPIKIPIQIIGRPTTLSRPLVRKFCDTLKATLNQSKP